MPCPEPSPACKDYEKQVATCRHDNYARNPSRNPPNTPYSICKAQWRRFQKLDRGQCTEALRCLLRVCRWVSCSLGCEAIKVRMAWRCLSKTMLETTCRFVKCSALNQGTKAGLLRSQCQGALVLCSLFFPTSQDFPQGAPRENALRSLSQASESPSRRPLTCKTNQKPNVRRSAIWISRNQPNGTRTGTASFFLPAGKKARKGYPFICFKTG